MVKEITEMGLKLKEWCKKYNKDYIFISCLNNNVIIIPKNEDKDFGKLDIFIPDEEDK